MIAYRKATYCVAAALALMASACESVPEISPLRSIVSEPTGAYVSIHGTAIDCTTPCTIKLDRSLKVTVSKEGYTSQTFYVEPGSGIIRVILKLAAASEAVESGELPEL